VTAENDPRLLRLAEAISDRGSVSWDDARSTAAELRPMVDGLERVQAVAAAFAAIQIPTDREEPERPATRWGQLELLEPIGEGAFGEVLRARDPNLDREVALKLRHAGPGPADSAGRRLLDEARRLARIRHPNVVAVYGADLCDGRVGIWTELIDGPNLEQRLAADGPFGAGEAVSIALDLCRALAAIHAAGLVHGDVKAANVLRERGGRIVLGDLGSATDAGATPVTGSPATLAPEVLAGGPATAAADLYSLGVMLFQLLSGRFPVDAAHPEAGRTTLRDLRPDLPPAVVEIVERAADPDPSRRFPSAGALEQALAGASRRPGQSAEPLATSDRESPVEKMERTSGVAVWAAIAVITTVAAFGIWQSGRAVEPPPLDGPRSAVEQLTAGPVVGSVSPDVEGVEPAAGEPKIAIAAGAEPAAAAPRALELRAVMLRTTEEGDEELGEGARIRPGDRLSLEIEAPEAVHVWVVNEDLDGNVFLLFPVAGLDRGNPLSADRGHRLPGRINGAPQDWQVTSAGGREHFLVIASRNPDPELERELAGMAAASVRTNGVSRGVGGLAPASLAADGYLDELTERMAAARRRDGSVWLMRLELVNP
jgi:serine/threonine protein kinase